MREFLIAFIIDIIVSIIVLGLKIANILTWGWLFTILSIVFIIPALIVIIILVPSLIAIYNNIK
jgi:hypothetical protein